MLIDKTKQKQVLDYNLPFQKSNKQSQISFSRSTIKEDSKRKQELNDISSRSNSIQGRKLSFCDAHLTVSQNTIESMDRIAATQRNRDEVNQSQQSASISQQHYSSFVINPSQSESILNIQNVQSMHMNGSRGKNPRQSKEPQKKKKKLPHNISVISNGHNSNKLQKAIKQQFKVYQQSQKKGLNNQLQNQSQRSPLQEKKSQQQPGFYNAYEGQQPKSQNKSSVNRNSQQPASFMLTFSKDKNASPSVGGVEKENKIYVNQEREGIINIIEHKNQQHSNPQTIGDSLYYKNFTPNQHTLSSGKKSNQPRSIHSSKEKRFSSPSPNSRFKKNSANKAKGDLSYYNNLVGGNRQSVDNAKSYIGSGEKDINLTPLSQKNQSSIDRLIRQNIKKQKERETKEQEYQAQQKEQLSQRMQKIVIKNQEIRKMNQKSAHNYKVKKSQMEQKPSYQRYIEQDQNNKMVSMKSKSPLKVWQEMLKEKNKDMPLKIEKRRNKRQLGLEIFDLKKEMGSEISKAQAQSIDNQSLGQITQRKAKQQQKDQLKDQQIKIVDQSVEAQYQAGVKNRKDLKINIEDKAAHPNKSMQKLSSKQYKKRSKLEKQEKFIELVKHQKVLENLKTLNHQIEQQRKRMSHAERPESSKPDAMDNNQKKHFKTVQESHPITYYMRASQQPFPNEKHEKSTQRQSQVNKERASSIEKQHKGINIVSARRQTLVPKLKIKQAPLPSSRVVYSQVNQEKPIKKLKVIQKSKPKITRKEKLIQMLLEQFQNNNQASLHQRSLGDIPRNSSKSVSKRKHSLKSNNKNKIKLLNYNQSVQQQILQAVSVDSPQLKIKNKRRSKQESRAYKKQLEQNDFSNLGSKSLQNSPHSRSGQQQRGLAEMRQQQVLSGGDEEDEDDLMMNEQESDQIILDEELMITCIINTAAQIIQKNFKRYMAQKKLQQLKREKALKNQKASKQRHSLAYEDSKEEFKDSASLENRLIPSKHSKESSDTIPVPSVQQTSLTQMGKKPLPKNNFSFGTYDEQNQAAIQLQTQFSAFNQNQKSNMNTVYSEQSNHHIETSPIDDKPLFGKSKSNEQNFIGDNNSIKVNDANGNKFNYRENLVEEKDDGGEDVDEQIEEVELQRVLNIDGKLRRAMQSLVEKQKTKPFMEQIKRKEVKQKPKQNIPAPSKQLIEQKAQEEQERLMKQELERAKFQREKEEFKNLHKKLIKQENSDQKKQIQSENKEQSIEIEEEKEIEISKMSFDLDIDSKKDQSYHNQSLQQQNQRPTQVQHQNFFHQQSQEEGEEINDLSFLNEENIMRMNNEDGDEQSSSHLASVGELTEKIIRSSPINTNEEILEAAVNDSNTLNNEESVLVGINESGIMQHSRVEDSQLNIKAFQSENGMNIHNQHNNSSMMVDEEDSGVFNVDLMGNQKKFGTQSEKSEKADQSEKKKYSNKQKSMLRLMYGDEQYLRNQEENDILSYEQDLGGGNMEFLGSGPSSNRLMHSENPYFLQTNASIFERNPFKEFTSNKLNEVLAGKNTKELIEMKEDAIRFQMQLEKGFINRLERKSELSPISSQRRKYELECWVTNERRSIQEQKKERQQLQQPLNVFDLEEERREAARIIEQVNKKAKQIKAKLSKKLNQLEESQKLSNLQNQFNSQNQESNVLFNVELERDKKTHHQKQKSMGEGKHSSLLSELDELISIKKREKEEGKEESKSKIEQREIQPNIFDYNIARDKSEKSQKSRSLSRLDLSEELIELRQNREEEQKLTMPDLASNAKESDQLRDEAPTVLLEISFDDDEEEEENMREEERNLDEKKMLESKSSHDLEKEESAFGELRELKQQQAEVITQEILEYLLKTEFKVPIRKIEKEDIKDKDEEEIQRLEVIAKQLIPSSLIDDNDYSNPVPQISKFTSQSIQEEQKVQNNRSGNLLLEMPNPRQPPSTTDPNEKEVKQLRNYSIDTSEAGILQYIDDIFDQIKSRKDLFMQAFATPIYKNPLEVLSNLQRPDLQEFEMTVDLSNSMACILNVQLYLTIEKARDNIIQQTIQEIRESNLEIMNGQGVHQSEDDMADLISESQHIHNKIIFDSVNEALNMIRPYANQGEPMPWSSKPKKNLIFILEDPDNINKILRNVKSKVVSWARTRAGALPPRYQENPNMNNQQMQALMQLDEEVFSQQREKCLAQMLARDLVEGEEKWLDYELEETQVKVDLSDIVLEHLVGEACEILKEIRMQREIRKE